MPDFSSDVYVFILAAFLGLEVIRRVSPLLHTPLMSLTNAISAISVIAAIELAGAHQTRAFDRAGHARGGGRVDQHHRRIHDHRPHAQDVQEARGEAVNFLLALAAGREQETMESVFATTLFVVAAALFVLALKWLAPRTPRGAATSPGKWGWGWPSSARCCTTTSSATNGSSSASSSVR